MSMEAKTPKKMLRSTKKIIKCELCNALLKSDIFYQRHLSTRHPKNQQRYVCDYDGKTFATKNYLRNHMERHKNQILICNVCLRAYNSRVSFRRHLLSHLEKYECSQCNASFSHRSLLNNHVASMHIEQLQHKCNFCSRMFASKSARNNHHQTHKNKTELNFKCELCKIFFETKEDLRIHSFVHYDGDIKACHICDQIFKSNRMLNIHLQKHSTKKYQCEVCLVCFVFKNGLKKHTRLNRCKGPPLVEKDGNSEELTENEIKEIAKEQLKEISNLNNQKTTKSLDKEIVKATNDEISSDDYDDTQILEKTNDDDNVDDDDDDDEVVKEISMHESPIRTKRGRPHMTYTCDKCGETIKFKKNLEAHMREEHVRRTYSCSYCQRVLKSRKQFKEHALIEHGVKERIAFEKYECKLCNKKFDTRSIFLTHELSHQDIREHTCEICSVSFKSIGNLKRHRSVHCDSRDFLCDICAKSFKTKAALKMHKAIHADFRVFVKCSLCEAIVQEKNLKIHIFNQHNEGREKKFECKLCKKCFKSEFLLRRHAAAVHENVSRGIVYQCGECHESFNRQKDLRAHSFLHYTGQTHPCNECGKIFKSKRLLLIHCSVHAPEQFPCNLCDLTFQTSGGRRKHIARIHKDTTSENVDFMKDLQIFEEI